MTQPSGSPSPRPDDRDRTGAPSGATAAGDDLLDPYGDEPTDDELVDGGVVVPAGTVVSTGSGLLARTGAEAFGSFVLVLLGLGIGLYASFAHAAGSLVVALGFGVGALAAIIAVGHVSGGHFNPAVTLGAAVAGRTPWKDVLPYWVAQVLGAAVAAMVVFLTIPSGLPGLVDQSGSGTPRTFFSSVANGFGEHSPLSTLSNGQVTFPLAIALLVEAVATAVFVGIILGATDRRANAAHVPFAVGLSLTVLLLLTGPVTNGSLNPARSLAAAIFSEGWAFGQLWLFVVAPLVGAAIAALVYRAFAAQPVEDRLFEEKDEYVTTEDVLVVEDR
ncbi:aquaporin [Cellulomonas marina]|uniref:Aquaporin Z n=1 Tax=Cellulomonas marina TaxID=988821 RepID=A0A1I1A100_9CELL|nr:aquaporin [Cellulomonas marina]GIG30308.1 hypothetical protein Cma02nite_29080 [Cellulomonas marina]SFB31601.1 aquaporin Z [Cellulomonas marina]